MEFTEIQSPTRVAVCQRLPANLQEFKFVQLGCYVATRRLPLGLYRKTRFQNERLVVVKGIFKIPSTKPLQLLGETSVKCFHLMVRE